MSGEIDSQYYPPKCIGLKYCKMPKRASLRQLNYTIDCDVDAMFAEKDAEIERLKALCEESLRCLKDAKRRYAPTTTNSDADVHITALTAWLKEKENG